jgi:surfactin synthase thioesterase subunit
MNFVTGKAKIHYLVAYRDLQMRITATTHSANERQHQQQPAQWTPTVTIPFSLSITHGQHFVNLSYTHDQCSTINIHT